MKVNLLSFLLIGAHSLFAQNFTQMVGTPFQGVEDGSIAFADVDGDNDQDVLITGGSGSVLTAKLYLNDGSGNFTEMTGTPFQGVDFGSIAFADVDGDNDQDVLITGKSGPFARISKLYLNDGSGNFTEMMGTPFQSVERSSIAFADVDGDNDQDVLITGRNSSGTRISRLYINDGSGNFTEMMGTPFPGISSGSIAFADVDGDNDQDVLITGANSNSNFISRLYLNDGSGNFTEMMGTPFPGVTSGSIAFADVDGDNDQDVVITGGSSTVGRMSRLYTNDGSGNFTEMTGMPFEGVSFSSIAFADVDGDNDQDLLITGENNSGTRISKLYINDGSGSFTEMMDTPFQAIRDGSVAFADVDGDNDQDVLITGQNSSNARISRLYTNDGMISSLDDATIENRLELRLFPNPSALGRLYIHYLKADYGEVAVRIYNIHGVQLRQQKEYLSSGQQTLGVDISSLPKGNYFLLLEDGKRTGSSKFIVQ